MLGSINYNAPITPVTLANNAGNTAPRVTSTGYVAIDGLMYGPTVAGDALLTNTTINAGNYAMYAIYMKPDLSFEAVKTGEFANSTVKKYSDLLRNVRNTTNIFTWKTGLIIALNDVVRYEQNFYLCTTAHTAGASFVASNFTLVVQPDNVSKAVLGYVFVVNASVSQFVGNTTLLNAAGISTIYIPETPVTCQ